jgi:hypothetical protein
MVSNKNLYKWHECDFISVTKAGYLTEYEIKVSKHDFKRDFIDKKIKHEWLKGNQTGKLLFEGSYDTNKEVIVDKFTDNFAGFQRTIEMSNYLGPNYFYYVCPEKLIDLSDIPNYAGLIYIREYRGKGYLDFIKNAPILHKNKITEETKSNIFTRYMYDYWKNNYGKK